MTETATTLAARGPTSSRPSRFLAIKQSINVVLLFGFLILAAISSQQISAISPTGLAIANLITQQEPADTDIFEQTEVSEPEATEPDDPIIPEDPIEDQPQQQIFASSGGSPSNGGGSGSTATIPPPPVFTDLIPPSLQNLFPQQFILDPDGVMNFSCFVSDNEEISRIELIIDGNVSKTTVVSGTEIASVFTEVNLSEGEHQWSCRAYDVNGNEAGSGEWIIHVNGSKTPQYEVGYFGGNSTDWMGVDNLRNVCDAQLERPDTGMIDWHNCVDAEGVNFTEQILIEDNNISVLFDDAHSFNSPAKITFEDLPWQTTPIIYRNGEICDPSICSFESYEDGTLVLDVTGFSSFTTGSNARLEIWDSTDVNFTYANETKYPHESVTFFANYTSIATGNPILSADCQINFTDQNSSMTYNPTHQLYEYTRSFSNAGNFVFNISCNEGSFEPLLTGDLAEISSAPSSDVESINGVQVERGASDRGVASPSAAIAAQHGNATPLTINASQLSRRWQGFYGNISGTFELSDGNGNALYQWDDASPTGNLFASNGSIVQWSRIYCVNFSQSTAVQTYNNTRLNEFIGYSSIAENARADSVNRTFNLSLDTSVTVGTQTFTAADDCPMVALHDNNGYDESNFREILLTDNASVVFTALLEQDETGFNSVANDFEMIVGVNGTETYTVRNYYFFVELSS